jgi:nucleoside-diphosphate-sugar epimerase
MGEDILQGCPAGITWDILRPPAVYGPGDREMLPLLKLVRRGIVPIIGDREARFSLLYADDLASAVLGFLNRTPAGSGRCFELHDGHPGGYTWRQIASQAAHLNGRTPRCFPIPKPVMQIAGAVNISLARLFGYQPMLSPGKVREIFHPDWVCDNTAISKTIGWQPRIQFQEGMKLLFYPQRQGS